MDMSKTIAPKTDQLNADDFIGGPRDITITVVKGANDPQQPVSIYFEGDNGKPYKPCLSMRRVMVKSWGINAIEYVGRSMTLFCDPNVSFGGAKVGGIRISHMSHIKEDFVMALTMSKARRSSYPVKVLDIKMLSDDEIRGIKELALAAASLGHDKMVEHCKSLPDDEQKIARSIWKELEAKAKTADSENGQ